MMAEQFNCESVSDFYAGKSVFITGASGFVGQVIVERLLYTCKYVDKVYVLMRDKRNKTSAQRHEDMVNNPLFAKLKGERPDDLNKIIPVIGDVMLPELGISPEDEKELIEKVGVVIHSAATIKLNGPLNVALETNLEGTRKIINLCKKMKLLKSLVYVSTAFCHPKEDVLEEKLYPPPSDLSELYAILNKGELTAEEEIKVLDGYPNTYTYSKAMTEHIIVTERGHVPLIIVRPSAVTPSLAGSAPGWISNWAGATGQLVGNASGIAWLMYAEYDQCPDIIPVDYVANLILVAAAKKKGDDVSVYNSCVCGHGYPVHRIVSEFCKHWSKYGMETLTIYPIVYYTKSEWAHTIVQYFQCIPAYIGDLWLRLNGQKPKYIKSQAIGNAHRASSNYFVGRKWDISIENVKALYASLSSEDREMFPFDVSQINWPEFIETYVSGIKKYLLKK